ncbi:fgf [Palpita vitrealis nucleopolyhedrovirus]|uniref:Fgf n=1 Tax=Palpita vitrealis nucleopolyhedrovirus TaxID=2951960 RepID=A0AAE9LNF5_9ABAC|nr:fgf [Palpita vitrealis nucleopolyhedrovirus]
MKPHLLLLTYLPLSMASLEEFTGTNNAIQMFINHNYLAINKDGRVYGITDQNHVDTMLKRIAVNDKGRIIIQNIVNCMFLCIARCGKLYASNRLSLDCFINEKMEPNNYNTYYKVYNRKLTFVALKHNGKLKRLQIFKTQNLSKLGEYTLVMLKRGLILQHIKHANPQNL